MSRVGKSSVFPGMENSRHLIENSKFRPPLPQLGGKKQTYLEVIDQKEELKHSVGEENPSNPNKEKVNVKGSEEIAIQEQEGEESIQLLNYRVKDSKPGDPKKEGQGELVLVNGGALNFESSKGKGEAQINRPALDNVRVPLHMPYQEEQKNRFLGQYPLPQKDHRPSMSDSQVEQLECPDEKNQ